MLKYKIGDKYSPDFDYDGMVEIGLSVSTDWSVSDLEKLKSSFVDVNYHKEARLLGEFINSLKNDESDELKMNKLGAFKIALSFEEDDSEVDSIMKEAYESVRNLCKKHGLILKEDYSISDGGESYDFTLSYGKQDDKINEIALGYFDENERAIGYITFEVEEKEVHIDFFDWQAQDVALYGNKTQMAEGGNVGEWIGGKSDGSFYGAKGLNKAKEYSLKYPKNLYLLTDDNNSHIGRFWLKNGKFARVETWGNPEYDLANNKVSLRAKSDVIYKIKRVNTQDYYEDGGTIRIPSYNPEDLLEISPLAFNILRNALVGRFITIDEAISDDVRLAAESVADEFRKSDAEELGSSDMTFLIKEMLDEIGKETGFVDGKLFVK